MDVNDLPLQELFTRLRDAGLPLGINQYQLVLQALQAGFGMSDQAALKRLCQTLWVKSTEERRVFEYHFEEVMGSEIEPPRRQERQELSFSIDRENKIIPQIGIYLIQGILAVGIILGVTNSSKQQSQENTPTPVPTLSTPTAIATQTPENSSKKPTATPTFSKPTIIATQTATLNPNPTQTPQSNTNRNQPTLSVWILPLVIALGGGGYVWVATRKGKQNKKNDKDNEKPGFSKKPGFLDNTGFLENKDEVLVAQAVQQTTSIKEDIPENRFLLSTDYFPVTVRQMKQIWRYLRRPVREGQPTVLDLEATVNQIGRQGILLQPVLVPRRVNKAELLLLIDQDGSMVPFSLLSRRLAETALRGGRLSKPRIYYFHNSPMEHLYHDPHLLEAQLVSDIITNVCSDRTAVGRVEVCITASPLPFGTVLAPFSAHGYSVCCPFVKSGFLTARPMKLG
ncbi:MAG: hypothetical protein DSM106950_40350, partial [Stigonema ocellatum SAG 48.90 = DSM 106950]|nr:hypothetical protein [Stigonema ocellatum SAG 48.90 = DSM 106950]